MAPRRTFLLNTGQRIDAITYGTFQSDAGNAGVKAAVLEALKCGYRQIDTAYAYGNERDVGEAIKESRIPREDLFIITKLPQTHHRPEDVELALNESLERLGMDYVDLYLMHFPHAYLTDPKHSTLRYPGTQKPQIDYATSRRYPSTWSAMERLVSAGKARAIGISNFNILKTKRILETCTIRPAVNQVELHPYLPQHALVSFSQAEGIHIQAHQPFGGRPVGVVAPHLTIPRPIDSPTLASLACSFPPVTPAQIILASLIYRGISVVPKSADPARMRENFAAGGLRLGEVVYGEVDEMAEEQGGEVRFLDPSGHIGFDIFSEEEDEPVKGREGEGWGVV